MVHQRTAAKMVGPLPLETNSNVYNSERVTSLERRGRSAQTSRAELSNDDVTATRQHRQTE